MNEIIESLYNRKSVRVYEEKAIPNEMKNVILEAAMQAPTAGCQQLYTILDITDQNLKEALAESCDHQPFIAKAPMVLVFCADCKKWYDAYLEAGCKPRKPDVGDLMLAVTDTAIPSPIPCCVLLASSLSCENGSNICSWYSLLIPMPVSVMVHSYVVIPSTASA